MLLNTLKKRDYIKTITSIRPLTNIAHSLGDKAPRLWIKEDDKTGLGLGGNKVRKLEYLVADALANKADTLITCGAPQSNHCRITAAAAAMEGLQCRLVIEERVPGSYSKSASGNNFLYYLYGVESINMVKKGVNLDEEMSSISEDLKKSGRKGYVIPGGGSNKIGATGYANAALEIRDQEKQSGVSFDYIVVASGSSGTHAGLLAGFHSIGSTLPVLGISVSRDKQTQEDNVFTLANETVAHIGGKGIVSRAAVQVWDNYVGPGYSLPTPEMKEAVILMAKIEGVLLDPVYTGKAFSGLIGLIKEGFFKSTDNVLFLHTGGFPALFAYQDMFETLYET